MKKDERDYKSFSSVAKSRFRPMASELGYEQITGIFYVKPRSGWYETFSLQHSSYGNPFFYLNYGVILPDDFPATRDASMAAGMHVLRRLKFEERGAFPCGTKAEIERSAEYALRAYKDLACPWFDKLTLEEVREREW